MSTIKSGWLDKQGGSLFWKDWKRKYFVLYSDGEFSMYQSVTDATAECRINIKLDCQRLETGHDCGPVTLPKDRPNDHEALFAIFNDEKKPQYYLCENQQECREWVIALDRAMSAPSIKKVPHVPMLDQPPAYTPREFDHYVQSETPASTTGAPAAPAPTPMPIRSQQPVYGAQPMYGAPPIYGQQPMYGQPPMYGPPMYGQPVYPPQPIYIQQAPQPQQSSGRSNTGSLLLAGGGGLLGGYLLGSMMSDMHHHHHHDGGGGHDHGGGGFDGGGGGFDF